MPCHAGNAQLVRVFEYLVCKALSLPATCTAEVGRWRCNISMVESSRRGFLRWLSGGTDSRSSIGRKLISLSTKCTEDPMQTQCKENLAYNRTLPLCTDQELWTMAVLTFPTIWTTSVIFFLTWGWINLRYWKLHGTKDWMKGVFKISPIYHLIIQSQMTHYPSLTLTIHTNTHRISLTLKKTPKNSLVTITLTNTQ